MSNYNEDKDYSVNVANDPIGMSVPTEPLTDAYSVYTPTTNSVHAMFRNPDVASAAVGALLDSGVEAAEISVMTKSIPASWKNAQDGNDVMDHATTGITVTTPEDAASGAMKGAGIGLGVGVIAAIGSIAIPGVGLVLGGGALATALAATAATGVAGALAGGVMGYLKDQGVDENVAYAIEKDFGLGGVLVTVNAASDKVSRAQIEGILGKYTGQDSATFETTE